MKIIPVLDIKNLLAVQAVAGRREEYEPLIDSRIISSPIIERALQDVYVEGYREIY
ncbi:MAG: HisA/HisF family protein, partial [Crenarchaeota archaeon]|nr:HisA/HisF family protein [Thermoproteota archaeon]